MGNALQGKLLAVELVLYDGVTARGYRLVLSDDSTLAAPIDGVDIHLRCHIGSQKENSIVEWSPRRHIMPAGVALSSFKSPPPQQVDVPTRHVQGLVPRKESHEYAGTYGFRNRKSTACRRRS